MSLMNILGYFFGFFGDDGTDNYMLKPFYPVFLILDVFVSSLLPVFTLIYSLMEQLN